MPTRSTYPTRATNLVVSLVPNQLVRINRIDGYCYGGDSTTQYWLQLFATDGVPADGATPIKSLQILGTDGFTFDFSPAGFVMPAEYLTVVLSTTENNLTIITGVGNNMDVSVDYDVLTSPTTVSAGDLTTGVQSLQVWAEAVGNAAMKRLVSLDVTEQNGVDTFVQIYATDAATAASLIFERKVLANATANFRFGLPGRMVYSQDADGTKRKGCTVKLSLTAGSNDAAGLGAIYAKYIA